jgi:hypothetical protein
MSRARLTIAISKVEGGPVQIEGGFCAHSVPFTRANLIDAAGHGAISGFRHFRILPECTDLFPTMRRADGGRKPV